MDLDQLIFNFPCQFPIKVLGRTGDHLPELVLSVVKRHAPDVDADDCTTRSSSAGRYLSVTVTITATSRAQLDAIYRDLTAEERIVMAL